MRLVYARDDALLRLKKDTENMMHHLIWEDGVAYVWSPVERSLHLWFNYRGTVAERSWIQNIK